MMGISAHAQKFTTSSDTISYSYGYSMAEQGLKQYMAQLGVIQNIDNVKQTYDSRIENATDASVKNKLEKEKQAKVDSLTIVNKANMESFMKGITYMVNLMGENKAYADGLSIGAQINSMTPSLFEQLYDSKDAEKKINKKLLLLGLEHSLTDQKSSIENASGIMEKAMKDAEKKKEERKDIELRSQYKQEYEAGVAFLEKNKQAPGVVTLPSGLQYKILTKGTGAIPTPTSKVKVHYSGRLIDGTQFDSSVERGEPTTFGVTSVIAGWTEALLLMPVGSKWEVYIPYNLAYGTRDMGKIKPYSTLIFDIELLEIVE